MRWNPAPRRQSREGDPVAAEGRAAIDSFPAVANPLTARMSKGVNTTMDEGQTMVPVAFDSKRHGHAMDVAPSLRAMGHTGSHANAGGQLAVAAPLGAGDGTRGWRNDLDQGAFISDQMMVRRLMPVECERLQGLPDDWTNIPWRGKPTAPDGPRYKAVGNAWAVPVGRWVARRIEMVEAHR